MTGDEARRRRDPPALSQAMQQLEQHRAKVLVIYSAERLVRSPLGILRIVARVEGMSCHVASLQDGGDLFLRGWFARMNLRILRKSTKDWEVIYARVQAHQGRLLLIKIGELQPQGEKAAAIS